ncbi:hypothetical protein [Paenisporosarcina sp. OV554]|uniref:hypothetical protein n=1 Tax=Paenisporosarcina sp. OV554 TaxID=2135694 RepID=UPI000D47E05A|nr:hypothetical protein [Paenisporosarcina sp. OV554]PUB07226.1 hypothetical protein C8K15_1477 [Paenisporosarcina sp. OV554]
MFNELTAKIGKDKFGSYDNYINNYMIKKDPISTFGDDLGYVKVYKSSAGYRNYFKYHYLSQFKEFGY